MKGLTFGAIVFSLLGVVLSFYGDGASNNLGGSIFRVVKGAGNTGRSIKIGNNNNNQEIVTGGIVNISGEGINWSANIEQMMRNIKTLDLQKSLASKESVPATGPVSKISEGEPSDYAMDKVFPQRWGAKGDGKTDCTAAIQAAIDAAAHPRGPGVAYLPAGVYKITRRINLRALATLKGAGMDKSIIRIYDDFSGTVAFAPAEDIYRTIALSDLKIDSTFCNHDNLTMVELDGKHKFHDSEIHNVQFRANPTRAHVGLHLKAGSNKNYSRYYNLVFDYFSTNADGAFQVEEHGDHQFLFLDGIKWYHCRLNLNFNGFNSFIKNCYINMPGARVGGKRYGGGSEIKHDGSGGWLYRVRIGKYWNQFSDNYFDGASGKAPIRCEVVRTQGSHGLPGVILNGYNIGLNKHYRIVEMVKDSKIAATKTGAHQFTVAGYWRPLIHYPVWLEKMDNSFKRYTVETSSYDSKTDRTTVNVSSGGQQIDDGIDHAYKGCPHPQGNILDPGKTYIRHLQANRMDIGGGGGITKIKKGHFSYDFPMISAGGTVSADIDVDGIAQGDVISVTPDHNWKIGLVVMTHALNKKIRMRVTNISNSPIDPPISAFSYLLVDD